MKFAADFRRIAREALRGRWGFAVIAGLLASLLGAIGSGGPELNIELNDGHFSAGLSVAGQDIISTDGMHWGLFAGMTVYILIFAIVTGIVLFVLGSVIEVGYSKFNLDLVDRRSEARLKPCLVILASGKQPQLPDFCRHSTYFCGRFCLSFRESWQRTAIP